MGCKSSYPKNSLSIIGLTLKDCKTIGLDRPDSTPFYNGSDKSSSEITIDKYRTNEILMKNGLLVAKHMLISAEDWKSKKEELKNKLQNEKTNGDFGSDSTLNTRASI